MNGEPLPPDHGFPARLVVPGWVGIASIKWLGELRVTTSVVDSPWNTRWYRMHGEGWSGAGAVLDRMPPKSTVDVAGRLEAGRMTVLRGRAWSGEATISVVEVSTDGGRDLGRGDADRLQRAVELGRVGAPLDPGRAGEHVLLSRATDSRGRRQPDRGALTTTTATCSPRSCAAGDGPGHRWCGPGCAGAHRGGHDPVATFWGYRQMTVSVGR